MAGDRPDTPFTDAHINAAFAEAQAAAERGEVPVGAVVVDGRGRILAAAGNRTRELKDPTAHAEILALRAAARTLGNERLIGCALYVTLEPCAMCAAALSFARLTHVGFGALDEKMGGVLHGAKFYEQPTCHWRPEVIAGLEAERSAALLRGFFRARRGQAS